MNYEDLANELIKLQKSVFFMQEHRVQYREEQGEMLALNFILSRGGHAYQKEICEKLNISRARNVNLLKQLERKDYIVRETDIEDGRQYIIRLTEKGKKFTMDGRQAKLNKTIALLQYLGEADAKEYVRLQQKIAKYTIEN